MDIKDIIKWLIPCLVVIFGRSNFRDARLSFCIFLLLISKSAALNSSAISDSAENEFAKDVGDILDGWASKVENLTKVMSDFNKVNSVDVSDYFPLSNESRTVGEEGKLSYKDERAARTFGRPLKKLTAALVPLAFQAGVAATWMFLTALLSAKGVLIGAAILKLLLIAGAAKIGTLFAHKPAPAQPHWSPSKEVHVHIHNSQPHETHSHSYEEHGGPAWSRDGGALTAASPQPYAVYAGPQTINTPYGSYVRVGPPPTARRR